MSLVLYDEKGSVDGEAEITIHQAIAKDGSRPEITREVVKAILETPVYDSSEVTEVKEDGIVVALATWDSVIADKDWKDKHELKKGK